MTTKSKKILIQTDRRETVVMKVGGEPIRRLFCEACRSEAEMVDLDSAVTLSGRGAHDLLREIKDGTLHSSQTRAGYLLICLVSLRQFAADDAQGGRRLL